MMKDLEKEQALKDLESKQMKFYEWFLQYRHSGLHEFELKQEWLKVKDREEIDPKTLEMILKMYEILR